MAALLVFLQFGNIAALKNGDDAKVFISKTACEEGLGLSQSSAVPLGDCRDYCTVWYTEAVENRFGELCHAG